MNWTGLAARAWDPSGGDEPQLDHDFIKNVLQNNPGHASMVFIAKKSTK
ncbi:MAG TPA: hypothetical protein VFZ76_06370 [Anaerolineales bacterium]